MGRDDCLFIFGGRVLEHEFPVEKNNAGKIEKPSYLGEELARGNQRVLVFELQLIISGYRN